MTRRRLSLLLLALAVSAGAAAHPHMSLDSRLEIEYDGELCRGFWADWTFDPYFSASIIGERDVDRDRRLDAAESAAVYRYAFSNLAKYGYFIYLRTGDRRRSPEKVERFSAEIRGGRLAYRFWVPVGEPGELNVAIMDTTYFCAVRYADPPAAARQSRPGASVPSVARATDRKNPVYYDPSQTATDNSRHTSWRPGLETAYPEELRARP